MPKKIFDIPGVGPVIMAKRRSMRNIRIAILSDGAVRVNLPKWASFWTAERFVKKHSDWIIRQKSKVQVMDIRPGDKIGRLSVVKFQKTDARRTTAKASVEEIVVKSPYPWQSLQVQKKLRQACEQSLHLQARQILSARTEAISQQTGLKYKELRIRKMTSRWGSCSAKANISLSLFLIQLPDKLIDYVILHELVHTKHLNHSPSFWRLMEKLSPNTKNLRKQLRRIGPALRPVRQP